MRNLPGDGVRFLSAARPLIQLRHVYRRQTKEPRKVWDTPEARELLAKSLQTDDPAVRQPIFDELDRLFRRDVPAIVFYNSSRIAATRTNVAGYKGWVANEQRFCDVGLQ